MLVVFDADGCLIDSEEIIKQSYRAAGVIPPDNILEQEGTGWLHEQAGVRAHEIHRAKDEHYLHILSRSGVGTLPPFGVARKLRREGHEVHLLSGAPIGTVTILKALLPDWPFANAQDGLRTPQKMRVLGLTASGVYIDDQARLVDVPSGWSFVRYTRQTPRKLYEEVRKHEAVRRGGIT